MIKFFLLQMRIFDSFPYHRLFFARTCLRRALLNQYFLIFAASFLVYFLNSKTIASGDSIPNSLLALNWLSNRSLNFDSFRDGYFFARFGGYFFIETQTGHLSTFYPIGTAIITFPIYFCFYLVYLISHGFHTPDLTASAFEVQRLSYEKLAATTITAFSVVVFYIIIRLKFSRPVALISTFIYAFATQNWVTSSQGLWQHGPNNLVLLCIILCLFKLNRLTNVQRPCEKLLCEKLLLVNTGILSGWLLAIRPTNILFIVPISVYIAYVHRHKILFWLLGLPSVLPSLAWNLYYFGGLGGGYGSEFLQLYTFRWDRFVQGFLGLLVAPSRGILSSTPILIYAIPGVAYLAKLRRYRDEQLLLCLLPTCLLLFLQYSVWPMWWGGASYGPRFLTDILPILCLSIGYVIDGYFQASHEVVRRAFKWKAIGFSFLLIGSIFVQVVGAFGATNWTYIPLDASVYTYRLWDVHDTEVERHARRVFARIAPESYQQSAYRQGLAGKILAIQDRDHQPIPDLLQVLPNSRIVLTAKLQNTGTSTWLGYETAAVRGGGTLMIRARLLDSQRQAVSENQLYISGTPQPQQIAEAIGAITFPDQPGRYELRFDLIPAKSLQALPSAPEEPSPPPALLDVQVVS